jgi:hypothetical protein
MASSSHKFKFPEDIPIDIYAIDSLLKAPSINLNLEDAQFVMEKSVDFEALSVNGDNYKELFVEQGWENYFTMLNGPK